MTQTNKQLALEQICQTYGINVVGENNQQIFLSALKPIRSIENLIKKLTGKNVDWRPTKTSDDFFVSSNLNTDNVLPLNKKVLEKILISFLSTSYQLKAKKFRLEPGTSEYRWRVYDVWGWHTIQTLPQQTGKQLCDEIIRLAGITNLHLPQVTRASFKNWQFDCHTQPIWQGTVIQLDLLDSETKTCPIDLIKLFEQPKVLTLVYIGNRHQHQHHPLKTEFKKLAKQFDVLTVGNQLNEYDVLMPMPKTTQEFNKIINLAPELVIINYPDVISIIDLAKKLSLHNINSLINITSQTPWPVLALLKKERLQNCHLIISKSAEMVCSECKTNIGPDKRISGHSENQHRGWLENEIWENGVCKSNHQHQHFEIIINDWDNDLLSVYKKMSDYLDQEIINGHISWHVKNDFANEQVDNYFNF